MKFYLLIVLMLGTFARGGEQMRWKSAATGGEISKTVMEPATKPATPPAVIIYLKNLSTPRVGQEADEPIIADFVKDGDVVLVLDYAHDPKATSPELNADVLKLRTEIADATKPLLGERKIDLNHVFVVPEGFRLRRDVEFARDGSRVLGMDLWYPAKPRAAVGALMEITCDNVNRMGNGSLLFCRDTLVEGGAIAGFAAAMIDHPVPPPYKGIDDPMPQCIERLEAAAKKLGGLKDECGLNGKIGALGFSRGAPMAAVLAAPGKQFVQAALVHGNRYDYLNLRADDPMLARFEKAWGPRDANKEKWASHGASAYLTKDAAPMFLNTSDAESAEYRDGLANFSKRLDELGVEHVYQVDNDGRGHRVSTDPKTLSRIYGFFAKHLAPP